MLAPPPHYRELASRKRLAALIAPFSRQSVGGVASGTMATTWSAPKNALMNAARAALASSDHPLSIHPSYNHPEAWRTNSFSLAGNRK